MVNRTINGATKRFVERMSVTEWTDKDDAFYVDSALTYDGAATSSVTGLTHLEGEEVTILADGATHPNRTVSSGTISLEVEASVVHVGLGYNSVVEPMLHAIDDQGATVGRKKKLGKVQLKLENSLTLQFSSDGGTTWEDFTFRDTADNMDDSPPLLTDFIEEALNTGYAEEPRVIIRQNNPLPTTILAMVLEGANTDRS